MNDDLESLQKEVQRWKRRYERERSARDQAESIGERAVRSLAEKNRDLEERVEISIRERESRIGAIFSGCADSIITIDETGIVEECNPATAAMFGYPAAEIVGRNVSVLMPAPIARAHDGYLAAYVETGEAKVIGRGRETQGRRKNGSTFPIFLSITEVHLPERRLFTAFIRDVSDDVTSRDRLTRAVDELERSHEDLLTLLDGLSVGSMLIDRNGVVSFVSNSELFRKSGIDQTMIGQRWDAVLSLGLAEQRRLRRTMAESSGQRNRLELKVQSGASSASRFSVEVRTDPRDDDARILFFHDVTELEELREKVSTGHYGQLVGDSPAISDVYREIDQVARGDWTVLIDGETGSGKELVARAIHAASARRDGPFVAVNCAGLGDSLLETQLFGHRRGAFTGATNDHVGLFEAASGGTILLDEIGDISQRVQITLLRVLQEREILRVGDTKARRVDVRVLAATNRNLAEEVAAGRFRQDLLYRLRVARVSVPPLRSRTADIRVLSSTFLARQRIAAGKPVEGLTEAALAAMERYSWPGNVRELQNAVQFATIACHGTRIDLAHLPPEVLDGGTSLVTETPVFIGERTEREQIEDALQWAEGNKARAARKLGISRATMYRRLREFGL